MSSVPTMVPVATLRQVMDNLVELENEIHDDLVVYRWRPQDVPQLDSGGALWNWLGRTSNQNIDTATWRDPLNIIVRIGIRHTDLEEDMALIEDYADAFILKVDPVLNSLRPLGVRRAVRNDMGMVEDSFNAIPVMAVEFTLTIERDRHITNKPFT